MMLMSPMMQLWMEVMVIMLIMSVLAIETMLLLMMLLLVMTLMVILIMISISMLIYFAGHFPVVNTQESSGTSYENQCGEVPWAGHLNISLGPGSPIHFFVTWAECPHPAHPHSTLQTREPETKSNRYKFPCSFLRVISTCGGLTCAGLLQLSNYEHSRSAGRLSNTDG